MDPAFGRFASFEAHRSAELVTPVRGPFCRVLPTHDADGWISQAEHEEVFRKWRICVCR
jgi:hypothetical protein